MQPINDIVSDNIDNYINSNNDNVSKTNNNNVNDNEQAKNLIAQKLVDKLDNPDGWLFYCKVAWRLPENIVWSNLELAQDKGRDPKVYFSWLCKRSMINKETA